MDPASIIGIAAATVQFVEVAVKVVCVFKEVCRSADNATDRNTELEESVTYLQRAHTAIQSHNVPTSSQSIILEAAHDCDKIGTALLKLLGDVKGCGASTKKFDQVKATLRAVATKRDVDKLELRLTKRRGELQQALGVETYNLIAQMVAKLDSVADKLDTLAVKQDEGVSKLCARLEKLEVASANGKMYDAILQSLFYPEMFLRQETIHTAHVSTFDWAFEGLPKGKHNWSVLSDWLRSGDSTYWICGKAGSGKSTLMSLILGDSRTRTLLLKRNHTLRMYSFFFWRPGHSELQKTVAGLLRSLLYQVCRDSPALAPLIAADLDLKVGQLFVWSEQRCQRALRLALNNSPHGEFHFFIDGLDEFEGDYEELLKFIFELQGYGNVRLCLASRPHHMLEPQLSRFASLRLEDLNRADISKFVTDKIAEAGCPLEPKEIVDLSSGIFLWAALVVRDLIDGHMSGDDEEMLRDRLSRIPRELHDMYEFMLGKVDKMHQRHLARVICLMRGIQTVSFGRGMISDFCIPSLAWLTASLYAREMKGTMSVLDFIERCHQTQRHTVARSKGLLEIHGPDEETLPFFEVLGSDTPVAMWTPNYGNSDQSPTMWPGGKRLQQHTATRRKFTVASSVDAEILSLSLTTMAWIHRSAYDFIWHEKGDSGLSQMTMDISSSDILKSLSSGYLCLTLIVPHTIGSRNSSAFMIEDFLRMTLHFYDETEKVTALNALLDIVPYYNPKELMPEANSSITQLLEARQQSWLLGRTAEQGHLDYLLMRQEEVENLHIAAFAAARILSGMLELTQSLDRPQSIDEVASCHDQTFARKYTKLFGWTLELISTRWNSLVQHADLQWEEGIFSFQLGSYRKARMVNWVGTGDILQCSQIPVLLSCMTRFRSWEDLHIRCRSLLTATCQWPLFDTLSRLLIDTRAYIGVTWNVAHPSKREPRSHLYLHAMEACHYQDESNRRPMQVYAKISLDCSFRIVCRAKGSSNVEGMATTGTIWSVHDFDGEACRALAVYFNHQRYFAFHRRTHPDLAEEYRQKLPAMIPLVWSLASASIKRDTDMGAWGQLYTLACLRCDLRCLLEWNFSAQVNGEDEGDEPSLPPGSTRAIECDLSAAPAAVSPDMWEPGGILSDAHIPEHLEPYATVAQTFRLETCDFKAALDLHTGSGPRSWLIERARRESAAEPTQ